MNQTSFFFSSFHMHRDIAPLREAADAVHFDTSKLSFEESEQTLLSRIQEKLK